jgi:branched-chain amino acid transport system permease protein
MSYVASLVDIAAIFAIVCIGYNMLMGDAGQFSVAQAAIFGVSAYAFAILTVNHGWSFWPAAVVAALSSALVSTATAFPAFRVRGDYLVAVSFGIQIVLYNSYQNLGITGGIGGISGATSLSPLGVTLDTPEAYLVVTLPLLAISVAIAGLIGRSGFGLVIRAMRYDERGALALGKPVNGAKVMTFFFAGLYAGIAGVIYVPYVLYVSPETFGLHQTIAFITIVLVGGAGTLVGPVVGAVCVIGLPEIIRQFPLPLSVAGSVNIFIYGLLLVLVVMMRPQGILGRSAVLHERRRV